MRPIFYIIFVLLVATGAYFWVSNNENKGVANNAPDKSTEQPAQDPYKDWKTYKTKSGINFKVPNNWSIREDDRQYLALEFYNNDLIVGYFRAEEFDGIHGSETAGPKINESTILIDGIESKKLIFEGDGVLEESQIEEKIYRDIIIDFKKDQYFYGIKLSSKIENQKLWQDIELFIESIEVNNEI